MLLEFLLSRFKFQKSIDATNSKRVGKFANDDWKTPNAVVKKLKVDNRPVLALFCLRPINPGDEVRFDYGQSDAEWRYKDKQNGQRKEEKQLRHSEQRKFDEVSVNHGDTSASGASADHIRMPDESTVDGGKRKVDYVTVNAENMQKESTVVMSSKIQAPSENEKGVTLGEVLIASGLVSSLKPCEDTGMDSPDAYSSDDKEMREVDSVRDGYEDDFEEEEKAEAETKEDSDSSQDDNETDGREDSDYDPEQASEVESDESNPAFLTETQPIQENQWVSDSEGSENSEEFPLRRVACLDNLNSIDEGISDHHEDISDSEPDEDEIIRDKDNPALFVKKVTTSLTTKNGKKKKSPRVYNSKHCCPFCTKLFSNFSQHILGRQHELEPEVLQITNIKVQKDDTLQLKAVKEKERKKYLTILRNRGDSEHNNNIIKKKKGEIILGRRLTGKESFSIDEYGPCPGCMEWLKLTVIHRHQSTCVAHAKDGTHMTKGNLLLQSAVISGRVKCEAGGTLLKEVFSIMRDDPIGKVAKEDALIIGLGNQWMTRNLNNKLMRKHYASAAMRLSSRLLLQLRLLETPATGVSMNDYIEPKYFHTVAQAALKVARQDERDESTLGAPSNALKLSFDVKRLASIKLAKAIQDGDRAEREKAKDFLELMAISWSTKLERIVLEERKQARKQPLPLPKDIIKLSAYLKSESNSCDLLDNSYNNFRKVAILSLAGLISYNRRRPGEVQAMKMTAYFSRKSGTDDFSRAVLGELTKLEDRLLKDQDVIEIRGKRGKIVPVLVPSYTRPLLEHVTDKQVRKNAGISSSNGYVFANNRSGVIRGGYAMKVYTDAAGLERPQLVRATNMRRYMATMSQGLNVTPQQQQWITDHLGHTLDVHRIYYRATSDVIERVDVAKLLLMMDAGDISKYKGKKLDDIQFEDLFEASRSLDENYSGNDDVIVEEDFVPDLPQEDDDAPVSLCNAGQKKKKKTKRIGVRHTWTKSEIEEVKELFSVYFRKDKTPGEQAIKEAMRISKEKGGSVWKLPLKSVKSKISWLRLRTPSK